MVNNEFHSDDNEQIKPLGRLVRIDRNKESAAGANVKAQSRAASDKQTAVAKKLVRVKKNENAVQRNVQTPEKSSNAARKSKKARKKEVLLLP